MDLFKLLGTIAIDNSGAKKALEETSKSGKDAESKLGKAFKSVGNGAVAVGKTVGVGMVAAGTAVAGLVTNATSAYANYEQLVGGVDTLFKDSSAKVQAYAEQAYETAGMSANEYMETVTSFSASLLQSLDGDTEKAADKADTAIRDMSDNANKMGTSMESIQNAYQGFAKQNYTMLDNLKLGYGGTKEEMQRLLSDAEKISGQKFDISSYGDVVDAIHVMQTEMGITGTTAKEASGTISGSLSSVKGAWTNLVTAMAADDLPLDEHITKFADSTATMLSNMLPRIEKALGGVVKLIDKIAPVIIGKIPDLLSQLLPSIISTATSLLQVISSMLPDLVGMLTTDVLPALLTGLVDIVNALIQALPSVINALVSALPTLIPMLVNALVSMLVTLCTMLPQIIQPIIDNLPLIITSIVDALMLNLPILIEGVVGLIVALVAALPQIVQVLIDAIPIVFTAVWDAIKMVFQEAPTWFGDIFKAAWDAITKIFSPITQWFKKNFGDAWDSIVIIWNVVKPFFQGVWEGIKAVFSVVKAVLTMHFKNAWEGIKLTFSVAVDFFKTIWNNIKLVFSVVKSVLTGNFRDAWEGIKAIFSNWGSFFAGLWDKIKNTFSKIGTNIATAIGDSVKAGINGVIGMIEGTINTGINLINGAIKLINEIPGVEIGKFKEIEFPRLAKGGVVNEPTLAEVGEDGAEAVVPLENNTGWLNKVASQLNVLMQNKGGLDSDISIRSMELQQLQVSELQALNVTASKILTAVTALYNDMGDKFSDAMDGMSFDVNNREFARLVRGTI